MKMWKSFAKHEGRASRWRRDEAVLGWTDGYAVEGPRVRCNPAIGRTRGSYQRGKTSLRQVVVPQEGMVPAEHDAGDAPLLLTASDMQASRKLG